MKKTITAISLIAAITATSATPAASWKLITKWWDANNVGEKIKTAGKGLGDSNCYGTAITLGQSKKFSDDCKMW